MIFRETIVKSAEQDTSGYATASRIAPVKHGNLSVLPAPGRPQTPDHARYFLHDSDRFLPLGAGAPALHDARRLLVLHGRRATAAGRRLRRSPGRCRPGRRRPSRRRPSRRRPGRRRPGRCRQRAGCHARRIRAHLRSRRRPGRPPVDRPRAVRRRRARLRAPRGPEGTGRQPHPDRLHRGHQHGRRGRRPVRERHGCRRDAEAAVGGQPRGHRVRRDGARGPAANQPGGRAPVHQRADARLRQERREGAGRPRAGQPAAGAARELDGRRADQPAVRPPADPVPRGRDRPADGPDGGARPRLAAARDPREHGDAGPVRAGRDQRARARGRRPSATCPSTPRGRWARTS